jgi:hypothetical protein
MQCPKCGSEQPQSDECRRCKVIISKYKTFQRRQTDEKEAEIDQREGYDHKKTAIVYWFFSLIFLVVGIGTLILIKRQVNRNYVPQVGMGILFLCLGLGLFLLGFKMHKKPVWIYWARVNKIRDGAYEVFAAEASGANMGWKIGFGIIWNLFVVLALVVAIVERPNLSWQLILFFLFFISGGLFLLLRLVIGNFLAGRSFKKPKLIVSQMPLKRGDVFKINYNQIVNKRLRLKSVVILLRCYEDNEVGRGKKSTPTRKTLHSDKKEINLGQEFAPGKKIDLKQEFMIPDNAPLSTAYTVRYQVRWVLEIQVFARKSFDFHAEFPIAVVN